MAELALNMLRDSINAFIDSKPELALEIIARDEEVDDINRQLTRDLTAQMKENETLIGRCINLMRVVKCIERIADHAANIAEDVYYLHRGRDIRHGGAELEHQALQQQQTGVDPTPPPAS